jgi:L-galactose dehydrogenase
MQYRELGRTGLSVSVLSLGGAALGDMYGELGPGEAAACVRRALDAGINLIDTSPYYGLTRSESVLGEILQSGLRRKIYLCTKAGRNGLADFDFSPAAMERSLDASLQRLRTDYVDLFIAHDIEFATDFEQVFTETAATLQKLKQAGKCRFIGMSGYPLRVVRRAIERCPLDVVISYAHFTLQNQRLLTELMPAAERLGVGVLNASPLCLGLLTEAGPPGWHPAPPQLRIAARDAAQLCRQRGMDIAANRQRDNGDRQGSRAGDEPQSAGDADRSGSAAGYTGGARASAKPKLAERQLERMNYALTSLCRRSGEH